MTTAQEALRGMLNAYVSPALRVAGFKGSAGSYSLPSDPHWMLLAVQRSSASNADVVEFTINVTVVERSAWVKHVAQRPYLSDKPNANVRAGGPEWSRRIGELTPSGRDVWWKLAVDQDVRPIAEEVVGVILQYGLPAMQAAASQPNE